MSTRKKKLLWKVAYLCIVAFICGCFMRLLQDEKKDKTFNIKELLVKGVVENAIYQNAPIIEFMDRSDGFDLGNVALNQLSPLHSYLKREKPDEMWKESKITIEEIEDFAEINKTKSLIKDLEPEDKKEVEVESVPQNLEKEVVSQSVEKEPVKRFTKEQLQDANFILKNFYTVDPTTNISMERLSYDKLMGYDASLKKAKSDGPQILIYHTHSQEVFADSIPGDSQTSVVGVGERLARILREKYGFNVLHHLGEYDKESRDYAYSYAAKGLQEILDENPSIEVVIDLHRDAVKEDTRLVTKLGEQDVAKFMFFNGMSYTNALGPLDSLPNPYIQENIAFAFQLKLLAEEYYPGLTRKTYLKGYRYNMQYLPKSLLIEVGAQNNTVEEAYAVCEPIAHLLSMVLTGRNRQ